MTPLFIIHCSASTFTSSIYDHIRGTVDSIKPSLRQLQLWEVRITVSSCWEGKIVMFKSNDWMLLGNECCEMTEAASTTTLKEKKNGIDTVILFNQKHTTFKNLSTL